jgi:hypothetical protein
MGDKHVMGASSSFKPGDIVGLTKELTLAQSARVFPAGTPCKVVGRAPDREAWVVRIVSGDTRVLLRAHWLRPIAKPAIQPRRDLAESAASAGPSPAMCVHELMVGTCAHCHGTMDDATRYALDTDSEPYWKSIRPVSPRPGETRYTKGEY